MINLQNPQQSNTAQVTIPFFRGFPYLVTRLVAGFYHIILLPLSEEFESSRFREIARIQAMLNWLPTCLVLSSEACLYFSPDLREQPSGDIPTAGQIEWGKLVACERLPLTKQLYLRYEMLQRFNQQLSSHLGKGYSIILGDVTKGGRALQPEEEASLNGYQANGIPNGLSRCDRCRELKGECFDPKISLVVQISCRCENENLCAACLTPLYERKLNANYYSESDGNIWHVPGYCALDHQCQQVIGYSPGIS